MKEAAKEAVVHDIAHPDWQEWVRILRLRPADDSTLLAWCDWLQDEYPHSSYHPLIRAMVEVSRQAKGPNAITSFGWLKSRGNEAGNVQSAAERAWQMFLRTWRNWPPFQGNQPHHMRQCLVHRGLMLRVVCSQDYWCKNGDQICGLGPVGEVIFTDEIDFWERAGQTVVQVSPNHAGLLNRLPHEEKNPHHTRLINTPFWWQMPLEKRQELLANMGCEFYAEAWPGKVGRFKVEPLRERQNTTVIASDVPAWPPVLA